MGCFRGGDRAEARTDLQSQASSLKREGNRKMVAISATELRGNTKIEYDGGLWAVTDYTFNSQSRGRGFVKVRIKNMLDGRVLEVNFRSTEKVEKANVINRRMEYLYSEDAGLVCMDQETFEQVIIPGEAAGDATQYLLPNAEVDVLFHRDAPVSIDVPMFVELRVTRSEPGIKGDTVSGGTKPATLETGLVVQVPLFVEEGDVLRVDTRSNGYVTRVSTAR